MKDGSWAWCGAPLWCPLYWRTVSPVAISQSLATWSEDAGGVTGSIVVAKFQWISDVCDKSAIMYKCSGHTCNKIRGICTESTIPNPSLVSLQHFFRFEVPVTAYRPNLDSRIGRASGEVSAYSWSALIQGISFPNTTLSPRTLRQGSTDTSSDTCYEPGTLWLLGTWELRQLLPHLFSTHSISPVFHSQIWVCYHHAKHSKVLSKRALLFPATKQEPSDAIVTERIGTSPAGACG